MYSGIGSLECLKNQNKYIYFQVLGDEREPRPQQTPELAHHGLRYCEFLPSIDGIITNHDFLRFILQTLMYFILQRFKINVKAVKK